MIPGDADNTLFARLVQRVNPQYRLLRAWPLDGGISAQVTALEVARPGGGTQRWVVRQHGAADRQRNPQIAADEFALLNHLHAAGLPVPAPLHLEPSGPLLTVPCLVVEYVAGSLDFAPADLDAHLEQCAATLARIHRLEDAVAALAFLPQQAHRDAARITMRPAALDESLGEGRIRAALEAAWPFSQTNAPALLHGDYWPGNLLWQDGQLAAVIDWEDAALGDPLADLANSRLEMLWAFGPGAMQRFTRAYLAHMPHLDVRSLPYWDLCAALRPASNLDVWAAGWPALGRPDVTAATMRAGHQLFVAQAFERLGLD